LPVFSLPAPRRALQARWLVVLALATALGGCDATGDVTGSISPRAESAPSSQEALRAYADACGKRYDADPGEKTVTIAYAKALKELGRHSQAAAVMESAAVKAPGDMEILGAYGKALADAGQLQQAADVLTRSYTAEEPNWSNMSAQGSIADQLGDHAKAQEFYNDALKIMPGEPSVLSNLGLSYALSRQLPRAEQALRQAVANPAADARMRANLGLVLALEGKFGEAEKVQQRDMSAQAATANVASIRRMIAQSNTWRDIQTQEFRKRGAEPATAAPPAPSAPPLADNAPAE
jgi:Flp pilus assembly protein TadD